MLPRSRSKFAEATSHPDVSQLMLRSFPFSFSFLDIVLMHLYANFQLSALYREVPRPEEIVGLGNFMPRIADNAEALIDYALSHIPPST